jgi:hypothetical protein
LTLGGTPLLALTPLPGIDLRAERIDAAEHAVDLSMYRQAFFALPATHRTRVLVADTGYLGHESRRPQPMLVRASRAGGWGGDNDSGPMWATSAVACFVVFANGLRPVLRRNVHPFLSQGDLHDLVPRLGIIALRS